MNAALPTELRRPALIGGIFLLLWLTLGIWLAWRLATAWPYSGHLAQFGLLIALPGLLFQIGHLSWLGFKRERLRGWRRWLLRLGTLLPGVFLATFLWGELEAVSLNRFESAMAPVVQKIGASQSGLCAAENYTAIPAWPEYLDTARPGQTSKEAKADLHHDGQRFILALMGSSMDIDGSTIFYDSKNGRWQKFHNDNCDAASALQTQTEKMPDCWIVLF